LYLVSRAFEDQTDTPILGMEKHLVPSLVSHPWGVSVTRLASPGASFRPGDRLTVATTHGGLDDDQAVQEAVIRHIKGPSFSGRIQQPTRLSASRSADDEEPSIEATVVSRVMRKGR
jgi:hypothetical protein